MITVQLEDTPDGPDILGMNLDDASAIDVAERLGLPGPNLLYRWKRELIGQAGSTAATLEARVCELEQELGRVARERRDAELLPVIQEVFWQHRRRYGARRIAAELHRRDLAIGVSRVARLMKTAGLQAIQPLSFTPRTTESRHTLGYNQNLLADREPPERINEVWVGGITYIPLQTGRFGYLALLMDLFSRRVVGGAYRASMTDELVLAALRRSISVRQPPPGLVHHTDRGGQHASTRYRAVLRRGRMLQSMSAAVQAAFRNKSAPKLLPNN